MTGPTEELTVYLQKSLRAYLIQTTVVEQIKILYFTYYNDIVHVEVDLYRIQHDMFIKMERLQEEYVYKDYMFILLETF